MTSDRRILWHLKKIELFEPLTPDQLALLAHDVEAEEFRRRRVIYMPGDPGDYVLLVLTGKVRLSRVTPDGKALTLAYRGPGTLFGELCILSGSPRDEMAEAAETALVARIERERFDRLLKDHASLCYAMVRILAETRRALERKVEDLVFKDVNAKLAELLLGLAHGAAHGLPQGAQTHGGQTQPGLTDSENSGASVTIKMTHQEMANLIGSTRETVSLTLSQFKRRQLIDIQARRISVTDPVGLKALI